jgi:hypothetical protein
MLREILTSPATLRVLLYAVAPLLGMVPGVTLDGHVISIDLDTAMIGIAAGLAAGGGVFAAFGKK